METVNLKVRWLEVGFEQKHCCRKRNKNDKSLFGLQCQKCLCGLVVSLKSGRELEQDEQLDCFRQ